MKQQNRPSAEFDVQALASRIRIRALEMVARAKTSHIGSALSIADIVAVLYGRVLKIVPADPAFPHRDRFILSKGHACVAVYAALAEAGFFDPALLETYGADGSDFMAHISHKIPGVEFSTGALGQGLSFGAGKALAAKRRQQDWRTFVVMSDGELAEGSNWEAFLFAAFHQLDSLTAIIDYNKLQSLGRVADTLQIEPLADKLAAFGWSVSEVDGHDCAALEAALIGRAVGGPAPHAVIAHTTKGKGVDFMEDRVEWHYRSPSPEQLTTAIAQLTCEVRADA